jgi:predicted DCC family thiol-disulfide oxidoreductase YuxK
MGVSAAATANTKTALSTSSSDRTLAPGGTQLVMLYDGHCRFCTQSAKKLARMVGPKVVKPTDFQDEGVLASYPGVSYDACMKKLHVITPDGRVYAGAAAVARLFRTFRLIGWMTYIYYVPGIRQLAELGYSLVAKYRYKLFGKTQQCDGGTCHLHG